MNKTIHELNSLSEAEATDEMIVYDVSSNESKKITKENLQKSMLPDYSQKRLISNSTSSEYTNDSYVMPENGMLVASGYGQGLANSFIYFEIDGVSIRQQGYSNECICNSVIAKKGTTIKIRMALKTENYGLYFVPFK